MEKAKDNQKHRLEVKLNVCSDEAQPRPVYYGRLQPAREKKSRQFPVFEKGFRPDRFQKPVRSADNLSRDDRH
ncbi:MAG: hypothetical protein IH598_06265 [Bacteroidales bacterium]|nr:hypothetical protein [Bacteroidales bacterium]